MIEALSVLIQVFSFQTFRKRVFLMAPIHHHFELMAWSETKIILRFWIVAAVCAAIGFTIYQQIDPLERVNAAPAAARPGPYLVVGPRPLRASRRRCALRARGEQVIGVDAARPTSAGLRGRRRSAPGRDGVELLERAARSSSRPGVPAEAPVVAAARARGHPGARRARARLAAAARTSSSR